MHALVSAPPLRPIVVFVAGCLGAPCSPVMLATIQCVRAAHPWLSVMGRSLTQTACAGRVCVRVGAHFGGLAISSASAAFSCRRWWYLGCVPQCMCQLRVACEPHLRGEGSRQMQPDPACMAACQLATAACTLCGCDEGLWSTGWGPSVVRGSALFLPAGSHVCVWMCVYYGCRDV